MSRNRKVPKKMSVVANTTMRFGAIILLSAVMAVFYMFSASGSHRLMTIKGQKQAELARLENDCRRESSRWEALITPEGLEKALRRNALAMKPPRPDQNIEMLANGRPRLGQPSLARLARRGETTKQVSYRRKSR